MMLNWGKVNVSASSIRSPALHSPIEAVAKTQVFSNIVDPAKPTLTVNIGLYIRPLDLNV